MDEEDIFFKFKNLRRFVRSIFLCFWTVFNILLFVIFYLVDSLSSQRSLHSKGNSFFWYCYKCFSCVSSFDLWHLPEYFYKFYSLNLAIFSSGFYFCFCFQYLQHSSPEFVLFAWLPSIFIYLFIWDVFKQQKRLCFLDDYTVVSKLLIKSFVVSLNDMKHYLYKTLKFSYVSIGIQQNQTAQNSLPQ